MIKVRSSTPQAISLIGGRRMISPRSEEHTSELQSQSNLVCRLLLEKKNIIVLFSLDSAAFISSIRCEVLFGRLAVTVLRVRIPCDGADISSMSVSTSSFSLNQLAG